MKEQKDNNQIFTAMDTAGKTLGEQIADKIIELIIDRQLVRGQKLPNEFELAQSLGVGRGTIREAVKLLVSRNVLEIRRGKGTYVSDRPGVAMDPLGFAFYGDRHKLALDLLEIRMMIEPQIVSIAARKASKENVEEMYRLCAEVESLIKKGENHGEADRKLHNCFAKSTQNGVMPNLLPVINYGITLFIDVTDNVLISETVETHLAIVKAIESGDSEKAAGEMKRHLQYNKDILEKYTDLSM
jgi:DNA-binding FadR family transcriptional regulator